MCSCESLDGLPALRLLPENGLQNEKCKLKPSGNWGSLEKEPIKHGSMLGLELWAGSRVGFQVDLDWTDFRGCFSG